MQKSRFALLLLALAISGAEPAQTLDADSPAEAIVDEMRRIAGKRVLWPGFEPTTIPIAVFDGETTHLFWHPSPPIGFERATTADTERYLYPGRHPSVTANTYADLGGTLSATMILDGPIENGDLKHLAGVALHEAFHVFQRQRHPKWQANEADLFLYPIEDPELLALRRMETEALKRALATSDNAESLCWLRTALGLRQRRFGALDEAFVAYERGTELNEGLAAYVQGRAVERDGASFPDERFAAEEVRLRAYSTGTALALLLDRYHQNWQTQLETADDQHLDDLLGKALPQRTAADCAFPSETLGKIRQTAKTDVAALVQSRGDLRARFDTLAGWRISIETVDGQPLWPQGFDPLNVVRLDTAILHTRFLRLGNDSGQLEAIDTAETDLQVLTEGAGQHPLFHGVRRAVIAGLQRPEVEETEDGISVVAEGFSAAFSRASAVARGNHLAIRLLAAE